MKKKDNCFKFSQSMMPDWRDSQIWADVDIREHSIDANCADDFSLDSLSETTIQTKEGKSYNIYTPKRERWKRSLNPVL